MFASIVNSPIDIAIIVAFLVVVIGIGIAGMRKSSANAESFFLSGRNMPWWLLGVSMVACTFSCDTPNLITDIVRNHGVSGNWVWWAFLVTGMLTAFVYAKLWRRSGLNTDLGFYELRYSGRPARFIRGFRALYLGVFFNAVLMGSSSIAAVKIGAIFFGLTPLQSLVIAMAVVGLYAALGGLTGSLWADFFQYVVAMIGAVAVAWFAIDAVGASGHGGTIRDLFSNPAVSSRLSLIPQTAGAGWRSTLMTVMVLPLAVQWWATWYPGAEPGGGGFVAQRMLAAKSERHAAGATLFFNFLHYAIRTWPWLVVALASLVVFPDLESMRQAFPAVTEQYLKDDLAYPAMVSLIPQGWLGLVVASLLAAYMSTIATQLNWGASYFVEDFFIPFVRPNSSAKEQVLVARLTMFVLAVLGIIVTLMLEHSKGVFDLMLQIGAGTGLLYLLRWFWNRINAWSEVSAMVVSFAVACFFQWGAKPLGLQLYLTSGWRVEWLDYSAWKLIIGIFVTTFSWLAVTFLTSPESPKKLAEFNAKIHGSTLGDVRHGLLLAVLGILAVWSCLFGFGWLIYAYGGKSEFLLRGILAISIAVFSTAVLIVLVGRKARR
ncbi:MAG: Na+:solute symporter [Kiritimatiellae bacterium]|nr:Na+:solute symporter [Kiritimatiellia bacterium]